MKYWLVKSEPGTYSWEQLNKDGSTFWDGVRNYQARNNLREMKKGDRVLFYHSNTGLEVVGIAQVVRESYADPTVNDERWLAVDLAPYKPLQKPVSLQQIKEHKGLQDLLLVRNGRLSVMPVTAHEYQIILELAATTA